MCSRMAHCRRARPRTAEVFTTRPDTLFGMSFLAVAPEHPIAAAVGAVDPAAAAFIAECRSLGTSEAVIETAEKRGHDTGLRVRHPFLKDVTFPVWIANFVLMEYGTGAIFGCPGARSARPRLRPQIRPGRHPGGAAARCRSRQLRHRHRGLCRSRHDLQFRFPRRAGGRCRETRGHRGTGTSGRRPRRGQLAAARLGHVAATLLGLPDPGDPLRRLRHRSGAGGAASGRAARRRNVRPAGQSAGSPPDLETRRLPATAAARGAARDRHLRHVRRQLLVFRAFLQSERRPAGRSRRGGSLDAGRPVHRRHRARHPASALCAVLHPRHETDRVCLGPGAVRRPVHPGHGEPRNRIAPRMAPGCIPRRSRSSRTAPQRSVPPARPSRSDASRR